MKRDEITQEILQELLDYDPETGVLTWKERDEKWFADCRACRSWNTRYAGTPALAGPHIQGYSGGSLAGVRLLAHRAAFCHFYGYFPIEVDHINGRKRDNRIANLRAVTSMDNTHNASMSLRNRSGTTGVVWVSAKGRWLAKIMAGGVNHQAGYFKDKQEAIVARKRLEQQFGFHPNHGRSKTFI